MRCVLCVCACLCIWISEDARGRLDLLKLELQVVVGCPVWVLGSNLPLWKNSEHLQLLVPSL